MAGEATVLEQAAPPDDARAGRYVGYARRAVSGPDAELTAVGPGTACGEYLRKFWQPVCLSVQLTDVPLAIRILGEDLVAFRDRSGHIGVLHRHCCHRGTSLEFGVLMEHGISCCYHGWQFDVDGTVLDTPGEPPSSRIRENRNIRQGAYPAEEFGGVVFAYLGDPALAPPRPVFDTAVQPDVTLQAFSLEAPCNWLQIYENAQDPVHVVFLHARIAGAHFDESNSAMQELDFLATPLGMMNVQTRRWGAQVWTRNVECILPNLSQTGAIWEDASRPKVFQRAGLTRWVVPIDDTNSLQIGWRHLAPHPDPNGKDRPDLIGLGSIDAEGQDGARPYAERQRRPGDYDAQVSQRPIAVHAAENLASSDRGVAMLRRLLRRAIRKGAPPAAFPADPAGITATFCQDTVSALPVAEGDDRALLRAHGAAVSTAVLSSAGGTADERRAAILEAVERLARGETQPDLPALITEDMS